MSERSRANLETKLQPGQDFILDSKFPVTKVEIRRGLRVGYLWIIRPRGGKARIFTSEAKAIEYATIVLGK